MAIQLYSGGKYTDKYLFNQYGYFFTIGPKNGSKLYQPGTQGLVCVDAHPLMIHNINNPLTPTIEYAINTTTTQPEIIERNVSKHGYAAMQWRGGVLRKQVSNQLVWAGLETRIAASPADIFFVPHDQMVTVEGVTLPWGMAHNRCGAKPILGTVESVNNTSQHSRYLSTSYTSYKTEVYVILVADFDSNKKLRLGTNIKNVIIPIYYTGSGQTQLGTLTRVRNFSIGDPTTGAESAREILMYMAEWTSNLPAMNLGMPIIQDSHETSTSNWRYSVQTVVTLKAD